MGFAKQLHGAPPAMATTERYIYLLKDPRDGAIRYVGCSADVSERIRRHQYLSRLKPTRPKERWIRELTSNGLTPVSEIVERIPVGDDWTKREKFWIAYYRSLGCTLTNISEGGLGTKGHTISEQERQARIERQTGRKMPSGWGDAVRERWRDPQYREKVTVALRKTASENSFRERAAKQTSARWQNPEYRNRMLEVITTSHRNPETEAKRSASIREAWKRRKAAGWKVSDDTRRKIREAQIGTKQSTETIEKRRIALLASWNNNPDRHRQASERTAEQWRRRREKMSNEQPVGKDS